MNDKLRRGSKRMDIAELGRAVVELATGQHAPETSDGKNPAAVALGRLGGLKGGKARAKALSSRKRKEIAIKAAARRWGKKK